MISISGSEKTDFFHFFAVQDSYLYFCGKKCFLDFTGYMNNQ